MQIGYGQTQEIEVRYGDSISLEPECALHPLIHTFYSKGKILDVGTMIGKFTF